MAIDHTGLYHVINFYFQISIYVISQCYALSTIAANKMFGFIVVASAKDGDDHFESAKQVHRLSASKRLQSVDIQRTVVRQNANRLQAHGVLQRTPDFRLK